MPGGHGGVEREVGGRDERVQRAGDAAAVRGQGGRRQAEEVLPQQRKDGVRRAQAVARQEGEHGPGGEGVGEADPGADGGQEAAVGAEEDGERQEREEDVLLVDLVRAEEKGERSGGEGPGKEDTARAKE